MFAVQRHFFFSRQLRVRRERHFFFSRQLYFLFTALLLASMQRCTSATQSARCFLISVSQKRSTIQPLSRSSMVFSRSRSTFTPDFFVPKLGTITNITHTMPKLTIAKNSYFVFGNDDIRMAAAHLIILAVADALVPQCLAQEDFYFGVLARVSKHSFMSLVRI